MRSQYTKRILKLRKKLSLSSSQALLISNPENITYLTGEVNLSHDWREAVLVLGHKTCLLLLSSLRKTRKRKETGTVIIKKTEDIFTEIKKACIKQKISSLGFEEGDLRVSEYKKLKKLLAPIKFKSTISLVADQRLIKDEKEIVNIKKACRITLTVYRKIKKLLIPGCREKEIAWEINKLLKKEGSEGIPREFSPIVAFGSNTAIPHHIPGHRKLRPKDIVLLDFGCSYQGYASDFTRVLFLGKPTRLQLKLLSLVKKSQKQAFKAVIKSNDLKKIDKAARSLIRNAGYGKYFIHGTGHGLGLSIHEPPSVSQEATKKIIQGMVFTLEPGIYLPNKFGVRHEDTILVTDKGPEILTKE